MAQKLQSSLALEGGLPGDGLAAYVNDGPTSMSVLARKIVSGGEDADSVESVSEDQFTSRRSHRYRRCPYNRSGCLAEPNAKVAL